MELFSAHIRESVRRTLFLFILILSAFTTQSCTTLPTKVDFKPHSEALLTARHFSVDVPSFDGKKLRATIYQPALGPGDTAPVIVHAHGFNLFRMSSPKSMYGLFFYTGQAALEAWKQGYWVVSFDQRGHGGSEGKIRVMHPEYEVRDMTYLLNWVEENLPRIKYESGDPLIGMIGESYGGGAQMMSVGLDPRIDAIIPVTTWHDFQESLAPNQVPKSGWLTAMVTFGNLFNPGKYDPIINKAYFDARGGSLGESFFNYMGTHAASHSCNCDSGYTPKADALIIQGFRDVLFPINQAAKNFDCLKQSGVDVRLIGTQDGHLLPLTQFTRSVVPGWHMEDTIHCGARKINTVQMALDWFDEKLKGKVGAADGIPNVCLTHDYKSGSVFSQIPIGGELLSIPDTKLNSGLPGLFELPMGIWDRLVSLIPSRKKSIEDAGSGGSFRPAFVPLKEITEDGLVAGVPIAEIKIDSPKKDAVVFIGVGLKRANSRRVELISDQINPVYGNGSHSVELAGISSRLEQGDIIGILVNGYSNQYRFSGSGWLTKANISGSIKLPIQDLYSDEYVVQSYVKP